VYVFLYLWQIKFLPLYQERTNIRAPSNIRTSDHLLRPAHYCRRLWWVIYEAKPIISIARGGDCFLERTSFRSFNKIYLTSRETPDRELVFPGWATIYQIVDLLCFARQLYALFSLSRNHDQKPSDKYFISFGLHLQAHTLSRLSHNTNRKPCNAITARKVVLWRIIQSGWSAIVITLLAS